MGCINSKAHPTQNKPSRKGSLDKRPARANSWRINDSSQLRDGLGRFGSGDAKIRRTEKERYGSNRYHGDQVGKKPENPDVGVRGNVGLGRVPSVVVHPGFGRVPMAAELKQVAAGWPTWLVLVAGEALVGWVPRCANTFQKLEKIGQGTYSSVYRARDLVHNKIVALKKVQFNMHDLGNVKFMAREIIILRRLDHPNIIKLEGLITSQHAGSLYLVFEYMEHDLLRLASPPSLKFSEPQVKCYMHQLLSGLDHCHSHGVLHRDIKRSNLLIDSNGVLKIADFGLATFFDPQKNVPMTSRVATLWYRSPELLLGAYHYGVGVDLWSTGCVLGELYAHRPILPGRTEVEQLHKIFKLCGSPPDDYWRKLKLPPLAVLKPVNQYERCIAETFKDIQGPVLALIDTFLSLDPDNRGTAASALKSEFFKEFDVKTREEVISRRDFQIQKQYPTRSGIFNSYKDTRASGCLVNPTRQTQTMMGSNKDYVEHHSQTIFFAGPLVKTGNLCSSVYATEHDHSRTVISGAARTSSLGDRKEVRKHDQASNYQSDSIKEQITTHDLESDGDYPNRNGRMKRGPRGNKIYVSDPLLYQSNKMDQMLEDHDRQLREFAWQTR